jgi:hypothetical protein
MENRVEPTRGETITPRRVSSAATASPSRPGKRAVTVPARRRGSAGVISFAPRWASPSASWLASAALCSATSARDRPLMYWMARPSAMAAA